MKKKPIRIDQFSLDKETIARLNEGQLAGVVGGQTLHTLSCVEENEFAEEYPQSCCMNSCNPATSQ